MNTTNLSKRRSSSSSKNKMSRSKSAELKVVYISSPMKVKTCASNFRSTVQQLTGRDSDLVDRLMDEYANNSLNLSNEVIFFDAENGDPSRVEGIPTSNYSDESPTSSGSMPLDVDEGFSFEEIFGAAGFLLDEEAAVFGGM